VEYSLLLFCSFLQDEQTVAGSDQHHLGIGSESVLHLQCTPEASVDDTPISPDISFLSHLPLLVFFPQIQSQALKLVVLKAHIPI